LARKFLYVFVLVWIALAIVPVVGLVIWPFLKFDGQSFRFLLEPTLDGMREVLGSNRWYAIARTLRIAATVTVIEIVLALPFALWLALAVKSMRVKALFLAALTIPFFLSLASRTMVWRPILGNTGLINTALIHLGIIDQPIDWLLFSEFSVHLGLIGPNFPTMMLPIYTSIALIDRELLEAGPDLGAPPHRVLLDIILPLILPGIVAGIIFTFVPMLGETVVPTLLGGGHVPMLGGTITSLIGVLNYPAAASLGLIVLVILLLLLAILRSIGGSGSQLGTIFESLRR
jgi:ABC-type spermidine/putrescine transport system permease subunit I